jgi:hypothetical protein
VGSNASEQVSLVDFDVADRSLKTVSLHYYEDEAITQHVVNVPKICVDPLNARLSSFFFLMG